MKKFTLRQDWTPIKLDVSVEMPEELDISHLRGNGPQQDEDILPESLGMFIIQFFLLCFNIFYIDFICVTSENSAVPFAYDINLMSELTQMGFPEEACKRAVFFTNNRGLNDASNWLMEHISDSDFAEPFTIPGVNSKSGLLVVLF